MREVAWRTALVRFTAESQASRTFTVVIRSSQGGYSGMLEVVDASGLRTLRSFDARLCAEVVSALALVMALAVDPDASSAPSRRVAGWEPPIVGEMPPAQPRSSQTWQVEAGISGSLLFAPAPEPMFQLGGFVEIEQLREGFSPAIRLRPYFAKTGVIGPKADQAEFQLLGAAAEFCPWRAELGASATIRPSAAVDAAWLRVRGTDVAIPGRADELWLAAALGARLTWLMSEQAFFELAASGVFPITRPTFFFDRPRNDVHEVEAVGFWAGAAAGGVFR